MAFARRRVGRPQRILPGAPQDGSGGEHQRGGAGGLPGDGRRRAHGVLRRPREHHPRHSVRAHRQGGLSARGAAGADALPDRGEARRRHLARRGDPPRGAPPPRRQRQGDHALPRRLQRDSDAAGGVRLHQPDSGERGGPAADPRGRALARPPPRFLPGAERRRRQRAQARRGGRRRPAGQEDAPRPRRRLRHAGLPGQHRPRRTVVRRGAQGGQLQRLDALRGRRHRLEGRPGIPCRPRRRRRPDRAAGQRLRHGDDHGDRLEGRRAREAPAGARLRRRVLARRLLVVGRAHRRARRREVLPAHRRRRPRRQRGARQRGGGRRHHRRHRPQGGAHRDPAALGRLHRHGAAYDLRARRDDPRGDDGRGGVGGDAPFRRPHPGEVRREADDDLPRRAGAARHRPAHARGDGHGLQGRGRLDPPLLQALPRRRLRGAGAVPARRVPLRAGQGLPQAAPEREELRGDRQGPRDPRGGAEEQPRERPRGAGRVPARQPLPGAGGRGGGAGEEPAQGRGDGGGRGGREEVASPLRRGAGALLVHPCGLARGRLRAARAVPQGLLPGDAQGVQARRRGVREDDLHVPGVGPRGRRHHPPRHLLLQGGEEVRDRRAHLRQLRAPLPEPRQGGPCALHVRQLLHQGG